MATRASGPLPARRRQERREAGAHHQLTLLADVDQAGTAVHDRAQAHQEDGRRHRQREAPPAGVADAAVEHGRYTAVHDPPVAATSTAASARAPPMQMT